MEGGDASRMTRGEAWALVARLVSWPGPQQLAAASAKLLLYPLLQAVPCLGGSPLPVADVVVAAWMLEPDAVANGVVRSHGDAAAGGVATERSRQPALREIAHAYGVAAEPAPGEDGPSSAGGGKASLRDHVALVAACWRGLRARLDAARMLPAFWSQEALMPAALAALEVCGVAFDPVPLAESRASLTARIEALKEEAHRLAGGAFLVTSPKDCATVLYDRLGLVPAAQQQAFKVRGPAKRLHRTTNEAALQALSGQHPLPAVILAHRRSNKRLTTYVEPFLKHRTRARIGVPVRFLEHRRPRDGGAEAPGLPPPSAPLTHEAVPLRLHSALVQTSTATGRLSSRFPNIQNLPKQADDGDDDDAAAAGVPAARVCVRDAIRASAPNRELLSVDYGQIEMRLLAHFAGDAAFVAAANPEMAARAAASGPPPDIYRMVAAQCFAVAPAAVSDDQRRQAKTCCLGFMYGQGKVDAARKLGVTPAEAAAVQGSLRSRFPGIPAFLAAARAFATRHGWVPTLTGRRRLLPGIRSAQARVRSQAERQSVNAVIQGSAADVIKTAMLILARTIAAARDAVFGGPIGRESLAKTAPDASPPDPSPAAQPSAGPRFRGELEPYDAPTVWTLAHCDVVHQIHDELLLDIPAAPGGRGGAEAEHRGRICAVLGHVLSTLAPREVERIGTEWLAGVGAAPTPAALHSCGGREVVRLVSFGGGFRCRFPVRFAAGPTYGSLEEL